MNTRILTSALLCFLFSGFAFAQPILTQAVHQPQMGDFLVQEYWDTYPTPGPAGPNANWNFNLTPRQLPIWDTIVYVSPPTTQWLPFTQANICARHRIRYDSSFADERFDYYLPGPGTWKYEGFYNSVISDNGPSIFYDLIHDLAFPLTYGDLLADSTHGDYYSIGVFPFNGFAYLEADGYGTLTINGNSYPNVLRVHEWDSINWQSRPFIERYRFFQENNRYPILTLAGNPGNWIPRTTQGVILGQAEPSKQKFTLYPNPSTGMVRFQTKSHSGVASIYDAAGKLIREQHFGPGDSHLLDLNHELQGLYLIRWNPESGPVSTHKMQLIR